jgi:hypothetical protein
MPLNQLSRWLLVLFFLQSAFAAALTVERVMLVGANGVITRGTITFDETDPSKAVFSYTVKRRTLSNPLVPVDVLVSTPLTPELATRLHEVVTHPTASWTNPEVRVQPSGRLTTIGMQIPQSALVNGKVTDIVAPFLYRSVTPEAGGGAFITDHSEADPYREISLLKARSFAETFGPDYSRTTFKIRGPELEVRVLGYNEATGTAKIVVVGEVASKIGHRRGLVQVYEIDPRFLVRTNSGVSLYDAAGDFLQLTGGIPISYEQFKEALTHFHSAMEHNPGQGIQLAYEILLDPTKKGAAWESHLVQQVAAADLQCQGRLGAYAPPEAAAI